MEDSPPMTWEDLARRIAAMSHEQRQRPVVDFDEAARHVAQPGLRPAENDIALDRGSAPTPGGSYLPTPSASLAEAPPHPADRLVLVALDLDDGAEPPAEFETATGIYYRRSEVEDVGEGRRMAWYFQQVPPNPT
jgi:hypothetical protein